MNAIGTTGYGRRAVAVSSLSLAVWIGTVTSPRPALAREREPVFLSFAGAAGCDDQRVLEREVALRLRDVVWTRAPDAPTRVEVSVEDGVGRVDSVVLIRTPRSPPITRGITASNCQEALEGTALIIAVSLSSNWEQSTPSAQPHEQVIATLTAPQETQQPARVSNWAVGVGASGAVAVGIAPGALPGLQAFVDIGSDQEGWAPEFRLGFLHMGRSGFASHGGHAKFQLNSGTLTACPLAFRLSRRWLVRPCAAGSYGVLEASGGSDGAAETSARHPWGSVGGSVRLEVNIVKPVSLEAEAGAQAALNSSRFWFGKIVFHESSSVIGRLDLGLSVMIP